MAKVLQDIEVNAIRHKWISDVEQLIDQLEDWLKTHRAHPTITRVTMQVNEWNLSSYTTSSLEIEFNNRGMLTIKPIARNYPSRGIIEVQAWPSLRRVRLLQNKNEAEEWTVYTDSGIPLHQSWNKQNFHQLINDLRAK